MRCLKSEGRNGKGTGCVKDGGHAGRCKVRADPQTVRDRGGSEQVVVNAPGKPHRAKGKAHGSLGQELAGLAEAVGAVEAEVASLLTDFQAAMTGMQGRVAEAKAKALCTLRALVKSRRQVASILGEKAVAAEGAAGAET